MDRKMLSRESNLYSSAYFDGRKDPRRHIAYQQDADKIMERAPNARKILDIGGGWGEFGKFFDCAYYCYDPFTLGNLLPEARVKFDVAIFRGSLQHIYNPVKLLRAAQMRLADNGLLAILATPDTDSIGYFRWGTLPALDPQRNWISFGHRMLENVLARLGFIEIQFNWPYGKPYARPVANLWNFIVGKPDAFPGNMMECFAKKQE